jgi:hypothetical protein
MTDRAPTDEEVEGTGLGEAMAQFDDGLARLRASETKARLTTIRKDASRLRDLAGEVHALLASIEPSIEAGRLALKRFREKEAGDDTKAIAMAERLENVVTTLGQDRLDRERARLVALQAALRTYSDGDEGPWQFGESASDDD